jgi:hypothetical protein
MKKFILMVSGFLSAILISFFTIFCLADGYIDPFYIRFTSPQQRSLILGTSRAAQGIQPSVLNKVLNRTDFFNYAFTLNSSPYGSEYLKSIMKKLDHTTKNGIFILTIDPWSICANAPNPNDTTKFVELSAGLAKTKFVNLNPNIYYLLYGYEGSYINLIKRKNKTIFLHNDGWLEVNVGMDPAAVRARSKAKIAGYRKDYLSTFKYSQVRFNSFKKTLLTLKKYGTVYVVRLPVDPSMMQLEDLLMKDFNDKVTSLSQQSGVSYLNMTNMNSKFNYTDGNHLYKKSGAQVTKLIAEWIQK